MYSTEHEVVLENVFVYKGNIYTDQISKNSDTYNCVNSTSNLKPLCEMPLNAVYHPVNEVAIFHRLEHAHGNIGHYFNDHFYALVVSWMKYKCKVLLTSPLLNEFNNIDTFNLKCVRKGNICWGISIFKALNFNLLFCDRGDVIYKIREIILPRTNRMLQFNNIYNIDPLYFIRMKVLNYVNPLELPYDVLFFNKKSDRNIINDIEVINWLEKQKLTYKVIECFRENSFADIVSLLYNTKAVVAPWGSHLTNILFMKPCGIVNELHPKNMRDCWWSSMGELFKHRQNIKYINIPCEYIESESKKRENTSTRVDVKSLILT